MYMSNYICFIIYLLIEQEVDVKNIFESKIFCPFKTTHQIHDQILKTQLSRFSLHIVLGNNSFKENIITMFGRLNENSSSNSLYQ